LKDLLPLLRDEARAAQAEQAATVLCNEILVVEQAFTNSAHTLAGRCYAQAAEISRLRREMDRGRPCRAGLALLRGGSAGPTRGP
jgi:hypothetical protein